MAVQFRNYVGDAHFTGDYQSVRNFLIRINQKHVITPGFLWGRWEWFFSLTFNALDSASLSRIGLWEDEGQIVAMATYEGNFGEAYFCVDERYDILKGDMLRYAAANMGKDGSIKALIPDTDRDMQRTAFALGFRPTQEKECTAVLDITPETVQYKLPEGYSVTSLQDNYDIAKYNAVLWKGFNHGDTPPDTEQDLEDRRISLSGPSVDLALKVAAVAPGGEFVSYCGMWHEPGTDYALVEPVATDPAYRRRGMGRAAVLEGVKRCGERGAKQAFVGSSQQFYYGIGFYPYCTETFWEMKC